MNISKMVLRVLMIGMLFQVAAVTAQVTSALGTIDAVMQDDNIIVIDEKKFAFRASDVRITWQGRIMRSSLLASGLRVRYTTHQDGSISELVLIGPARMLEQIDAH